MHMHRLGIFLRMHNNTVAWDASGTARPCRASKRGTLKWMAGTAVVHAEVDGRDTLLCTL